MITFDIAYSLNRTDKIQATTYEAAEAKLRQKLESEGINFDNYTLDVFDTVEEEEDSDNTTTT